MNRLEVPLFGLFFACWVLAVLHNLGIVGVAAGLDLTLYQLYSVAAVLGWVSGNVYVHRRRACPPSTAAAPPRSGWSAPKASRPCCAPSPRSSPRPRPPSSPSTPSASAPSSSVCRWSSGAGDGSGGEGRYRRGIQELPVGGEELQVVDPRRGCEEPVGGVPVGHVEIEDLLSHRPVEWRLPNGTRRRFVPANLRNPRAPESCPRSPAFLSPRSLSVRASNPRATLDEPPRPGLAGADRPASTRARRGCPGASPSLVTSQSSSPSGSTMSPRISERSRHAAEAALLRRLRGRRRSDLGYRFATFRDEQRLAGLLHPVEQGEAGGLELRDGDRLHGSRLPWSTIMVISWSATPGDH